MVKHYYLLGDFGGTNFQLRYILREGKSKKILIDEKHPNKDFKSVTHLISDFKKRHKRILRKNTKGMFALARGIDSDVITLFNNNFVFDKKKLIKQLDLKSLEFVNDIEALAYATLTKTPRGLINKPKKSVKGGPSVVITSGTGLGKCILVNNRACLTTLQSGGGHTDLPYTVSEVEIVKELSKVSKKRILTYEDVLSGRGLEHLYTTFYNLDKNKLRKVPKRLSAMEVSSSRNKYAKQSKDFFSKILGRIVRNYILETLPFSGIYFAGGILQKNGIFNEVVFTKELFRTEIPKLAQRIEEIPFYLLTEYNASLEGLYKKIST